MSKHETPMTHWYWRKVGGTLIEEFYAVPRGPGCGPRCIDGVIIKGGEFRIAKKAEVDLAGKDLIVIQTKPSRLGMNVMGQALFSKHLLERFNPRSVESVALVTKDDDVLRPIFERYEGMRVVVCPAEVTDIVIALEAGPTNRTIVYGTSSVPLLTRDWKRRESMVPYYRIDHLKPGLNWRDMPTGGKYREHYVQLEDGPIPVGVMIARELLEAGAEWAVCTDLTMNRMLLLGRDLRCVAKEGPMGELLDRLYAANGNRWAGLPDAVGFFPDGRVALREGKVAGKDRLNKNQHEFARAASELLGEKLDLAVVEWGRDVAAERQEAASMERQGSGA